MIAQHINPGLFGRDEQRKDTVNPETTISILTVSSINESAVH